MIYRAPLLAGLALLALETPSVAQGSLADQIAVCAGISKKDARLECYDSVAQANRTSVPTNSASTAPTPPPATAPQARPFGEEQLARQTRAKDADKGPSDVQAIVTSATDTGRGLWQIQLADGAVWRMTEAVVAFRPPAVNDTVSIQRGALGSYRMKVGRQGAVRVMRVR